MRALKFTLICLCLSGAAVASAAPAKAQPSIADALKEAAALLEQGRFQEAADGFQRADELAGGSCGPCLLGLSRARLALQQPERAADAARKAVDALRTPEVIAQAWNQLGMALMSRPRPDLAGAEEAFRKAMETGAGNVIASVSRYNLADVLWREKKYAESEQMARAVLEADPAGPAASNARIVLCQARSDGAPVAPPEEVYAGAACPKDEMRMFDRQVVVDKDKEVTRPEKMFGRPPAYDDKARIDKVEGTVVLEAIIDEDGCVQKLRVCKSVHPSLDLASLDAVRRWVFKPAALDGEPVKVYYTLSVNFMIGNRPGPG